MRTLAIYFVLLLPALAVSCDDEPRQTHQGARYDYDLPLPQAFVRQNVIGIDSKVEEFRSEDAIIGTDLGYYSAPPECSHSYQSCEIYSEDISGHDSLVGVFEHGDSERSNEPKPYRVFVHIQLVERNNLNLNMFARCDTKQACDDALGYFRGVSLLPLDDWPADIPPPPPIPQSKEATFDNG